MGAFFKKFWIGHVVELIVRKLSKFTLFAFWSNSSHNFFTGFGGSGLDLLRLTHLNLIILGIGALQILAKFFV